MKKRVGFIGLGVMGKPMAINIIKSGYALNVFDLNPDAVSELIGLGATAKKTPCDLARNSDVVMTMLPDAPEVESVYLGAEGILEGAAAGTVCIDSSTINPEVTKKVGKSAAKKNVKMIDAPVGGGQANAEVGNLIMLVGADPEVLAEVRDILETVGGQIIHAGPLGSGEALKLANNLTTAILGCLLAEGLNFADKIGIEKEKLVELLSQNVPRILPILARKICENDMKPGFMTRLMAKDLRIIFDLAETHRAFLPVGSAAGQMYRLAMNRGLDDNDFTSIYSIYE